MQFLQPFPEVDFEDACAKGVMPYKPSAAVFAEVEIPEDCLIVIELSWQGPLQDRVAWPEPRRENADVHVYAGWKLALGNRLQAEAQLSDASAI